LNQTEIARKLGISVNYSSYLLRRAIAKIKTAHEELQQHETAVLVEHEPTLPIAANNIAIYDPLSGVYTGAYLRVRVSEEIARSKRYPMNFAVMLVQIDGLAEDHAHYEQCLREIGVSFRTGIRMVDLLGYMGSEQFVFLLPHTGREARVLGERLCAQMSTRELLPKGSSPALNLCIGFAVFPTEGTTTEMLFDRATKALDIARKGGPGTVLSASAALYPR
jgi:diguanylate cyclase (GGDEF)-like protein